MSYTVDRRGFLRIAGGGAAALGLGGALASCGSEETGTVTLTWWDYNTLESLQPDMNRLIKDIEENVPGVRIERRTFPFAELDPADHPRRDLRRPAGHRHRRQRLP